MQNRYTYFFLVLFIIFLPLQTYTDGFLAGTLVKIAKGYVPIETLAVNDYVICLNHENRIVESAITYIGTRRALRYAYLYSGDTCLGISINQRLCFFRNKEWITLSNFKSGDLLVKNSSECCQIDYIELIDEAVDLYLIEVEDYHNFYVSHLDVWVHNFTPAIAIGVSFAFGCGAIEFSGLTVGLVGFGAYIGCLFSKKKTSNTSRVTFVAESCSGGIPPNDPNKKKKDRDNARSNYRPLTNKEAREKAYELGYGEDKDPPFNSHDKPAFRKGNQWITPDRDGHKGGVWKMFRGGERLGTYTVDLMQKVGK